MLDYAGVDNGETARLDEDDLKPESTIDSDTTPDTDDDPPQAIVTKAVVMDCLRQLRIYGIQNNVNMDSMTLISIEKQITAKNANKTKQSTLTNFFKQQ